MDKHRSTKHTYKTKDRVTRTPLIREEWKKYWELQGTKHVFFIAAIIRLLFLKYYLKWDDYFR